MSDLPGAKPAPSQGVWITEFQHIRVDPLPYATLPSLVDQPVLDLALGP